MGLIASTIAMLILILIMYFSFHIKNILMISIFLPLSIMMFIYLDSLSVKDLELKSQPGYKRYMDIKSNEYQELIPLYNQILNDDYVTDEEYFEFMSEAKFLDDDS